MRKLLETKNQTAEMVVPFAETGEVQNAEKERQKEKLHMFCAAFWRWYCFPVVRAQRQMVQMKKFSYTETRHSTPKTTSPMSTRTTAIPAGRVSPMDRVRRCFIIPILWRSSHGWQKAMSLWTIQHGGLHCMKASPLRVGALSTRRRSKTTSRGSDRSIRPCTRGSENCEHRGRFADRNDSHRTACPRRLYHLSDPYGCRMADMQAGVTDDGNVRRNRPYRAVQVETDQGLTPAKMIITGTERQSSTGSKSKQSATAIR